MKAEFVRGILLMVPLVLLASGCATVKVSSDYDHQIDYTSYQSFRWIGGEQDRPEGSAGGKNALLELRIRRAVENQLLSKGYTVVAEDEDADMLVAYHTSIQTAVDATPDDQGYAYGRWAHSGGTTSTYDEGTLVLDLIDAEKNEMVWRGSAVGTIDKNMSSDEIEKRINDAVAKILDKFPPS